MSEMEHFLKTLFPDSRGLIEIRCLGPQGTHQEFFDSMGMLLQALPRLSGLAKTTNIYLGVCPRTKRSGGKEAVKQVWCFWIDADAKAFQGGKTEALTRLREFPLPPTAIIDSGHGYHAYWRLKEAEDINGPDDVARIEAYLKALARALGGDESAAEIARILRLPETLNLKDPSASLPVEIVELDPERQFNPCDFESLLNVDGAPRQKNPSGWIAEAFAQLSGGNRNATFTRIAGRLFHDGWTSPDILALLTHHAAQCQFPQEELQELVEGICHRYEKSRPAIPHAKKEGTPPLSAMFDGLVDVVESQGRVVFLVQRGDQLVIQPDATIDGVWYLPPPREQIPWLLPQATEVMRYYDEQRAKGQMADGLLFDNLRAYLHTISELPDERYYDLLTAWVLHTYLLEHVHYSPILAFFAVPERGKTRTGKGVIYVAYRGAHVETLREANLIRLASHWRATLFFDVMNLWRKAERNQSEDLILHRFEKGAMIPRVLYPERGPHRDTVYFKAFGATVISTNESLHHILETRAIQITMPESHRSFEQAVTPEAALPLKARLLAFRARHLGHPLPNVPKPVAGRLGDILQPLVQIIHLVQPDCSEAFLTFARTLEIERQMDRADGLEASVLEAILQSASQVHAGVLPVKTVTEAVNADLPVHSQLTPQRVGRLLRALGLKRARLSDGSRAICWDSEQLQRLCQTYGVKLTSDMSGTSSTQSL